MFHKSAWIILIGFAFVLFNPSDPGGSKRVENAIRRINLHPVNGIVRFVNTHPLYSDLSVGELYLPNENLGPDFSPSSLVMTVYVL